ncbi:MAG TPA: type VI secretion system baseplate subunit TssK [Polyangiaceae bacterium]|nr:type VI secretion system baseplate subunit TssK [Polyangiaceae bacterium]
MNQPAQGMTRVHWHLGQALLPAHFMAQEESLRAEASLRFSMLPLPAWGLGRLEFDTFLFGTTGVLSVRELSLVFESGTVLDIPGNAAPVSLDLKELGRSRTPVYVHFKSDFTVVKLDPGHPGEEGIERLQQRAELSGDQAAGEQWFQLAEVRRGAQDAWEFCPEYVPPLLRVRPGLLFDTQLERMRDIVNRLRHDLREELLANHLSGETHVLAKQALRSLYGFQARLADLGGQVPPHPYELFSSLRGLYIDTCVLRNVQELEALEQPYDHRDIGACFQRILEPLSRLLSRGRPEVPYVEFSRKEGLLYCDVDKNVKRARDVFLLVQKPSVAAVVDLSPEVSAEARQAGTTARVKLASPSRLHFVHERALTGIPYRRIERPPFAQSLSSTVDVYALGRGQEWDYAVAEGRIVLFDIPALEQCRLYLYSRVD